MSISIVGLDIAKNVFQAHAEDASGRVVMQKRLSRLKVKAFFEKLPPCIVAMEACGTSHYWGRVLRELGHEARLIPAGYVKPFVKRNKNDARDAAAICVAASRPDMRAVPIKSEEQQAWRGVERARDLLVKQRTQLMNHVRAMISEFGVVAAQGYRGFAVLAERLRSPDPGVPEFLAPVLRVLLAQIEALTPEIAEIEKTIEAAAKASPAMRRLTTIPGVGWLTAHAIVAAIGEGRQFSCGRDFAAWVGLTPRESSSAGKRKDQGVSRQGESRLRKLLALGAATIMRNARAKPERATAWRRGILARRPMKVAVLAQAAKTARIAWAVLVSGASYREPAATRAAV
jgi:transposase